MPLRAFIVFNEQKDCKISHDVMGLNALTGIHCF